MFLGHAPHNKAWAGFSPLPILRWIAVHIPQVGKRLAVSLRALSQAVTLAKPISTKHVKANQATTSLQPARTQRRLT